MNPAVVTKANSSELAFFVFRLRLPLPCNPPAKVYKQLLPLNSYEKEKKLGANKRSLPVQT